MQDGIGCKQAGKKLLLSKIPAAPSVTVFNLQAGLDLVGNSQLQQNPMRKLFHTVVLIGVRGFIGYRQHKQVTGM